MDDARPSPNELLNLATREEAASRRGKLKVFFGMAPGVGKTYAMLESAQRLARDGLDVAVGLVETHGRSETEHMLLGLDLLPRRRVQYAPAGGAAVTLEEFDLEAALRRKPDVLLIDELAHTNAPGQRFSKRWEDVRECLSAGIDVHTTLNVQHLESLSDVVARITGVEVRETVPDSVVEDASEIELVDLPPEALLGRLRAGKVYLAENAARAVDPADGFFRRGNLTALRELALRRTAQWVDAQMRRYKSDRGIHAVWPASERIIVAVSPSPMSANVVRAAKRMAAGLHAELIAVYVESARKSLTAADRERVMRTLRLATSLGAETVTLTATQAASELVAFARSRNASRIVVGKTTRSRLADAIFGSFVTDLVRASGDIDLHVVRGDAPGTDETPERSVTLGVRLPFPRYAISAAMVALVSVLASQSPLRLELANIAMLFLAVVVIAAVKLGRGPAALAAVAGVAAFDFFFVEPRLSFSVSDLQYVVTFGVMLMVGLLIAELTTRLRDAAADARRGERRTAALYAMSSSLAAARDLREVAAAATARLRETFRSDVVLCRWSGESPQTHPETLATSGDPDWFDDRERSVSRWSLDHAKAAGLGTRHVPAAAARHLPIVGATGKLASLALRPERPDELLDTAQLLLLETCIHQIAQAIERVQLIESRHAAKVEAESERLRSALLSSVSHDLRTPLATIAGAASTLEQPEISDHARHELIQSIVVESARLSDLIANLVFATRLEAGGVELRREWTTVEEIIGAGLARHREPLASRPFSVKIQPGLPLIRVDNAMLPQVVHNLVENALRYSGPGVRITVAAWKSESGVVVRVADEGPGLATGEAAKVFGRFFRGRAAHGETLESRSGMGLGLTICQGVIRAHGGRIWSEPNQPTGVAFLFSLPAQESQPELPAEHAAEGSA